MQYKKEEVKKAILKAAKIEFIKSGYYKASIRKIAKEADVIPGNIYNYFDGKDNLFQEILRPILKQIEMGKKIIVEGEFNKNKDEHSNLFEHQEIILHIINFIEENRDLLKLLLFKSSGSSLAKYPDQLIEWYTDNWYKSISSKEKVEIDKFIVRIIVSFWYSAIREVLLHDVTGDRLKETGVEIMTFIFSGYGGLIEWKQENL